MYRIICDGKEIVRQGVDRISAINGRLTQQINAADQLTFTLPATHPYLSNAQPRSSIIELWRDNECLFIGDVLQVSSDIYNNATFTCQGALAWLNDSAVPHPSFSGSASEYFERLITKYSGDAEQARQLNFGTSNISTSIQIEYLEDIKSVFELVSLILSNVGGYLFLRYEGDGIYVDYLTDKGRTSGQTIRFGENLTGIENFIDASKFITRVYPVGKDGLDIRAVNDGKWFVANSALEATHGVIAATVEYSDIEDANALKTLATNYLNASAVMGQTLSLTAIDLSLLDSRVDRIEVGDAVKVQSKAHGLDATLKVVSKETDIINPENSKLELGLTMQSISGMVGSGGGATSVSGGSITPVGAVLYNQAQSLTEAEKAQARTNIGAGTGGGGGDLTGAVRYDIPQSLDATAKARARQNIGAGTSDFDGEYSSLAGQPTIPAKTSDLTNDSGFGTYSKPANGIPKADLASSVQSSLGKADTAYQKPSDGIPTSDLSSRVQLSLDRADTAYQKPANGIPKDSLSSSVQLSLNKADTAYQKPADGIPENHLSADVRAKLNTGNVNITTISTEGADPLYPYITSKTLEEIKEEFEINKYEQFAVYNNIAYKLEKIIIDNGVEKAVFYSNSRLVSNVLTYYTCEIYDCEFGYSTANFHTYTVSGGEDTVTSVNGQTGVVVLDASDVGAQRTLIAGSGITIIEGEDGDIIQSDASGGSGVISFVEEDGGAPIAEFALNQTEDYEINVNDLTVQLRTRVNNLETSLSNDYRTSAEQDIIDDTKLTDAPKDGKEYARKNGAWHEVVGSVQKVNGETGVVFLDADDIPSTKTPTILNFVVDGEFDTGLVGIRRNSASGSNCTPAEVAEALQSGFTVTVGVHDQSGSSGVVFSARPVKYDIKNGKIYLYILADHGHSYDTALFIVDAALNAQWWNMTEYDISAYSIYEDANDLPYAPTMTVEQYLEALEARIAALEAQ